jgi:hypothetical protein
MSTSPHQGAIATTSARKVPVKIGMKTNDKLTAPLAAALRTSSREALGLERCRALPECHHAVRANKHLRGHRRWGRRIPISHRIGSPSARRCTNRRIRSPKKHKRGGVREIDGTAHKCRMVTVCINSVIPEQQSSPSTTPDTAHTHKSNRHTTGVRGCHCSWGQTRTISPYRGNTCL